jgi:hypothetical protein
VVATGSAAAFLFDASPFPPSRTPHAPASADLIFMGFWRTLVASLGVGGRTGGTDWDYFVIWEEIEQRVLNYDFAHVVRRRSRQFTAKWVSPLIEAQNRAPGVRSLYVLTSPRGNTIMRPLPFYRKPLLLSGHLGCSSPVALGSAPRPILNLRSLRRWQSRLHSADCRCGDRHCGALRSTRFLDRGVELMRECLDDARAKSGMWGAGRFLGS